MQRSKTERSISVNLSHREAEYINYKQFKIFCGSFNVNGKFPDEDLRSWLFVNEKNEPNVDIYAIGFQELVDLSTTSFFLQTDWIEREQYWTDFLTNQLNARKDCSFKCLIKHRMFGLILFIFISEQVKSDAITEIFANSVPTGIMETVGNKGSIGVSFALYETRILFICSHFAADTDKLQKRNSDYRSTRQRLKFEYNANHDYYDIDSHEIVFWFGDLNYRLDNLSLKKTFEMIYSNEIRNLLQFDQLTLEKENSNVFTDFNEGEINFRPTYKYLPKSDIYEKQPETFKPMIESKSSNENEIIKVKLPSWTDRVLWKCTSNELKVNQLKYSSINTLTISDHKPIYALFNVEVKQIDEQKYNKIYESLLRDSDKKTNDEMPRISIENPEFKFGECMFYDMKRFHLKIKNEGVRRTNINIFIYDPSNQIANSESEYEKTLKLKNDLKKKEWIQINPQHKERIESGTEYKVELITNFNKTNLNYLNRNSKLDDFLIVRCLNGNDLFVTISCIYKPTIIGVSLRGLSTFKTGSIKRTFFNCDLKNLFEKIEFEIENYEKKLNEIWLETFRNISIEIQKEKAKEMLGVVNFTDEKIKKSRQSKSKFFDQSQESDIRATKIEIHKRCFVRLTNEIIENDNYFFNELSNEFTFLMEHLIERQTDNSNKESKLRITDSIEEEKNLILNYLSGQEFEKLQNSNFDLDILVEVLYDLLYSMPSPLIPSRYIDFCMFLDQNYEEALTLFNFVPRSHFKLFEFIVKYLQQVKKTSNSSSLESDMNLLLANAIFQNSQLNLENFDKNKPIQDPRKNIESYNRETADNFLRLFVQNHLNFRLI